MIGVMALRSPIMFAAVLGALSPGLAHGEDAQGAALKIVMQVNRLSHAGQHAAAAKLAAEGVAREDLASADRVQLAGLARRSFELSYEAGGVLTELCGLAAVMRLAATLDTAEGGALKRAEAAKAEAMLERVAGPGWRAVCEPADGGSSPTSTVETGPERDAPGAVNVGTDAAAGITSTAPRDVNTAPPASRRDPGRLRAGVGTLVPGLLLFAPMAAVLARRGAAERDLQALQADTAGRPLTKEEGSQVEALNQRYRATTVAAAVLGATGAALAVTGVVLVATLKRRPRVAVAPWGARGVGGLVLEGKF
jgi:hypothetical protein